MPIVLRLHNHDVEGLPQADDLAEGTLCEFCTAVPSVQHHVGSTALLLVALGRDPRCCYLWAMFTIESVVLAAHEGYRVRGHGFVLNPPQELTGPAFDAFRQQCPKFEDFNDISDLPYAQQLVELAKVFHRPHMVDKATRRFYDELCTLIPTDPDAYVHRSRVLEVVGDSVGSIADMQTAAELFAGFEFELKEQDDGA